MAAEIKSLKGQLKLDPKLSAIAGKGDKGDDKKDLKKKNKKNTNNKREQKKDEAWKKEPPKAGESKEGKKVGKFTFNWCEHHMAWTVHKPADCLLGKQHKEEQKKPIKANSATIAAAATSAMNPQFRSSFGRHGQPGSERMMARAGIHALRVSRASQKLLMDLNNLQFFLEDRDYSKIN